MSPARPQHARIALLLALALQSAGGVVAAPATIDPQAERAVIDGWRAQRLAALTSDDGWLTLAGLFWLKDGDNSFGRAAGNALVLDNPALTEHCGTFTVSGHAVRFTAAPGSGVTHDGQPVQSLALAPD